MEKEIIAYGIASGNTHGELAGFVNGMIGEGWQPYGNAFTTIQHNALFIHQPMVMHEVKKKTNLK